jgi:hypothetical protein
MFKEPRIKETRKKGRAAKKRSDALMTGLKGTAVHEFKAATRRGAQENLSRDEQRMLLNEQQQMEHAKNVAVEDVFGDLDFKPGDFREVSRKHPMQDPWRRTTDAYKAGKVRKAQAKYNKRLRRSAVLQARD